MNTQERNLLLDDAKQAMLEALRGLNFGNDEEDILLELIYFKISKVVDTLKLPDGAPHAEV